MFSAKHSAAAPWLYAIAAALLGASVYLLIARSVDPYNPHWPAASIIGLTLGVHIFRRSRLRVAAGGPRSQGGGGR